MGATQTSSLGHAKIDAPICASLAASAAVYGPLDACAEEGEGADEEGRLLDALELEAVLVLMVMGTPAKLEVALEYGDEWCEWE